MKWPWTWRKQKTLGAAVRDICIAEHQDVSWHAKPGADYVMSPDEKLIHDWLNTDPHEDLGGWLPMGVAARIQQAIAAGRHHLPKQCAHCSKPIEPGIGSRWSTDKLPVHEACRTDLYEGKATLGKVGSRPDGLDHAAIQQNLDGSYDGKLVRNGDRFEHDTTE